MTIDFALNAPGRLTETIAPAAGAEASPSSAEFPDDGVLRHSDISIIEVGWK
jgi:hypothetical protein